MSEARLVAVVMAACIAGATAAMAQTAVPDEAVKPNGAVAQERALTPAQRSAIYNLISRQRVKPHAAEIPATIGAAVPQSADLPELPDQDTVEGPLAGLKYATVEGYVILVDPVGMRVVDVIRDPAKP